MSEKENTNSKEDVVYEYLKSLTDDLSRIKDSLNEFSKDEFKESIKETLNDMDKACEKTKNVVSKCVKEHPVETILAFTAVGLLIGVLAADKKK